MHVFRLIDFEGEANESIIRTKVECRDHKLEKTKGNTILLPQISNAYIPKQISVFVLVLLVQR